MSRSRRALSRKWSVLEERAEKAEATVASQRELLGKVDNWFRANYSYIYEDSETMQLWANIESELAKELAGGNNQ